MNLLKIDTRIPDRNDLILLNGILSQVTDVDLRKKIIWINTPTELKKIPLRKYDIYEIGQDIEQES